MITCTFSDKDPHFVKGPHTLRSMKVPANQQRMDQPILHSLAYIDYQSDREYEKQ